MTLNSSGPISLGEGPNGQSVNWEAGFAKTNPISLNSSHIRELMGGWANNQSFSDFYGKSNDNYLRTVTLSAGSSISGTCTVRLTGGTFWTGIVGYYNGQLMNAIVGLKSDNTIIYKQVSGAATPISPYLRYMRVDKDTLASPNIYLCGQAFDNLSYYSGYLAKVDGTTGSVLWQKYLRNTSGSVTWCYGAYVDSSGNVYTLWSTNSGSTNQNLILTKHDSNGTALWMVSSANTDGSEYCQKALYYNEPITRGYSTSHIVFTGTRKIGDIKYPIVNVYSTGGGLLTAKYLYLPGSTYHGEGISICKDPSFPTIAWLSIRKIEDSNDDNIKEFHVALIGLGVTGQISVSFSKKLVGTSPNNYILGTGMVIPAPGGSFGGNHCLFAVPTSGPSPADSGYLIGEVSINGDLRLLNKIRLNTGIGFTMNIFHLGPGPYVNRVAFTVRTATGSVTTVHTTTSDFMTAISRVFTITTASLSDYSWTDAGWVAADYTVTTTAPTGLSYQDASINFVDTTPGGFEQSGFPDSGFYVIQSK